jgi:hypothetical protein
MLRYHVHLDLLGEVDPNSEVTPQVYQNCPATIPNRACTSEQIIASRPL